MIDRPYELVPKIYKFEWNPTTASWDSVWGAVAPLDLQNTWPAFTWGDLDNDGRAEIYWAPVNYCPYPEVARILVYEYPGDGSDNMGVYDGFGGFTPNASTTIVSGDRINLRPIRFVIADPDGDGTDELIFADRAGTVIIILVFYLLMIFRIIGGGLETWTTEFNGLGDINLSGTGSKWDLAVLNNYIYLFDGNLN